MQTKTVDQSVAPAPQVTSTPEPSAQRRALEDAGSLQTQRVISEGAPVIAVTGGQVDQDGHDAYELQAPDVAAAAHEVHARWATLTPEQRAATLMAATTAALAKAGVPPVPWSFGDAAGATAAFIANQWRILFSRESFDGDVPTQAMMALIGNITFHECRHAMQLFETLRLDVTDAKRLEKWVALPALAPIIAAARLQPIAHDSPEAARILSWGVETELDSATQNIERTAMKYNGEHKAELDAFVKLYADPNTSEEQKAAALSRMKPVIDALRAYASLPFEADAYQVGQELVDAYASLEDPVVKK